MRNLGYYEPIKNVIEKFKYYRPYGWEVFSFGCWLIEKYGVRKYVKLYKAIALNGSLNVFKDVYGLNLDELEKEWLKFLNEKYGSEKFTKTFVLTLSASNPIIIYDDTVADFESLAHTFSLKLKKVSEEFFGIMPWENNITLIAYSEIKVSSSSSLLSNHNVIVISLSNSTVFKEISKEQKISLLDTCNRGFKFLGKCYSLSNDMLFIVTTSKHDKLLGFFIGNSVENMKKYVNLMFINPFSKGNIYVNSTVYVLFNIPTFTSEGESTFSEVSLANMWTGFILLVIILLVMLIIKMAKLKHANEV